MTNNEYRMMVGRTHKMMDKAIDKSEIEQHLINRCGLDKENVDEIFGIILRATCNKLKKYYRKEEIEETLNR